jgi:hypothetical protein
VRVEVEEEEEEEEELCEKIGKVTGLAGILHVRTGALRGERSATVVGLVKEATVEVAVVAEGSQVVAAVGEAVEEVEVLAEEVEAVVEEEEEEVVGEVEVLAEGEVPHEEGLEVDQEVVRCDRNFRVIDRDRINFPACPHRKKLQKQELFHAKGQDQEIIWRFAGFTTHVI